jgi:mannitol-specific phosphotransferase system IIBC component
VRTDTSGINYLDASIRGIVNAFEKSLAKILFFNNAPRGGVLNPIYLTSASVRSLSDWSLKRY